MRDEDRPVWLPSYRITMTMDVSNGLAEPVWLMREMERYFGTVVSAEAVDGDGIRRELMVPSDRRARQDWNRYAINRQGKPPSYRLRLFVDFHDGGTPGDVEGAMGPHHGVIGGALVEDEDGRTNAPPIDLEGRHVTIHGRYQKVAEEPE